MSEESATTPSRPTLQPRKRWGIVTQTVLLITSIATIAVVIAGIAVAPFVRSAAVAEASGALERLADLTAAYVERSDGRRPPDRLIARPLERILRREGVTGYLVSREGGLPPALQGSGISDDEFNALLAGESISSRGRDGRGGRILIEGRPVTGGAVILTQSVDVAGELGTKFLVRIAAALALGLVISVGIAYLVARRLSRPLRDAQGVAHRMAGGERDERLTPRGPAEVADIAEALNALNAALATSEGRQREFLLSVSHELRTPLTAIRGYAEALNDDILDPEQLTSVGATIGHEASRLDRLVHDLLDLARLGAADFHVNAADVDVREILTEAAEVWRTRCDRDGVTLTLAKAARPIHVHVDAMRQPDGERVAGFSPGVADSSRDPYGRCDRRWLVCRHRGSGQRPRFKRGRPCCRLRAGCAARAVSRCAASRHRTGPGASRSTRLTHGGRRCRYQQSRGGFVLLDQNPPGVGLDGPTGLG